MNKEELIKRYGEEAWLKKLAQKRAYNKAHKEEKKASNKRYRNNHREEVKEYNKKYQEAHPEEVKANNHEGSRKGGKYYAKHLTDGQTGLRGDRNAIRKKHADKYRPFKNIIAPESQLHHEWVPKTAEYRGVALVEADQHMHGFVDVIQILDGEITLLTEEEVKMGKKNGKETD
jgi:hypothetical protein